MEPALNLDIGGSHQGFLESLKGQSDTKHTKKLYRHCQKASKILWASGSNKTLTFYLGTWTFLYFFSKNELLLCLKDGIFSIRSSNPTGPVQNSLGQVPKHYVLQFWLVYQNFHSNLMEGWSSKLWCQI